MVEKAGGWLKSNVPAVVTWILLALTAAAAIGARSFGLDSIEADVVTLKQQTATAMADRANLRGDHRVSAERMSSVTGRVDRLERSLGRLENVTARLEALATNYHRGMPAP